VANLELVRDPAASIIFRAKRKIKKGEELTIRYTDFLDSRQNVQRKTQREWMFTCQCARCSDPTELGSNFSSFQCSCRGFYHQYDEDTDCMAWRCSHCLEKRDLEEKYKEADNWITKLDDNETVNEVLKVVESKGYHDNFYVTTKCFMKYVEKHKTTLNKEVLESVVDKVETVLNTLKLLDDGCTRPKGKYLKIFLTCQEKLLEPKRNAGKEINETDIENVLSEIAKRKQDAEQMLSPFTA
jgi:hypothetical protein